MWGIGAKLGKHLKANLSECLGTKSSVDLIDKLGEIYEIS
jgi:hypothetical protein